MAKVKQIEAQDQETKCYGGDPEGLVPAQIQNGHVLLHLLILFFFVHQFLHFCFLQGLSAVDPGDEVEILGSLGSSALPQ